MDILGNYKTKSIKKSRYAILAHLNAAAQKHHVYSFVEVDVTEAKKKIQTYFNNSGKKLSFTGWLLTCIGKLVSKYPEIHSYFKKQKKRVIFEDVDCSITVEKLIKGHKVPMPLVIRKINEKNIYDITKEIRDAQNAEMARGGVLGDEKSDRLTKIYQNIPRFLRKWIYKRLTSDPFFIKKYMGTLILTSVGMFGKGSGWPFMSSVHNLAFGVGTISEKPRYNNNNILEKRQILHLTIAINHDVIDGAPAARFVSELIKVLEEAYGL
ncbi:MAG: Catalytic domain of components of various dehydrogenase complexes [Promethearchaeota archaeon]|nr:MAG: Catalytic domain of components of various dehydrogenase complexes [Candidatus Lokiarchaeota archaeon]